MAPQEIAALTAQVDSLDCETARRVARLVVECHASLRLALLAVQDANQRQLAQAQPRARRRLSRVLAYFGAS